MWTCPKCNREFKHKDQHHFCKEKPETIDEYIMMQDESVQASLYEVRKIIKETIPDTQEKISWSMPTFWKGRNIIHFAAFKNHIGLYPGAKPVELLSKELDNLQLSYSKGTIRIPYSMELPIDFIQKLARIALQENQK